MELIAYLIVFCAGAYCGHIVSPWVDGLVIDFQNWQSRESDDE